MYGCPEWIDTAGEGPFIMINFNSKTYSTRPRQRILVLSIASIFLGGPIGCSSMPNWADPVEWYGDTKRWIFGTPKNTLKPPKGLRPIPGIGKNFPKLSTVPARPAPPSKAEQKKMEEKLKADRKGISHNKNKRRNSKNMVPAVPVTIFQRPVSANETAPEKKRSDKKKTNNDLKLVFGKAPPDIMIKQQSIKVKKSKIPVGSPSFTKEQNFVQAKPFTIRFPPGTGGVSGNNPPIRKKKVASILFKVGSKNLSKQARQDIQKSAALFKQRGGSILVVGHASSRTRDMSWQRHHFVNLQLSHDRAHTVATELRRQGVGATAIRISAISDSQPAFSEVMPAEEAGNRRVEIFIEK